jgi:hypothetical protein
MQAPRGPTTDREITCLSCGAPLSSVQNGALADAEFLAPRAISEIEKQAQHEALLSKTYHGYFHQETRGTLIVQ